MAMNAQQAREAAGKARMTGMEEALGFLERRIERRAYDYQLDLNLGEWVDANLDHWPHHDRFYFIGLVRRRLGKQGYRVSSPWRWALTGYARVRW